MKGRQYLMNVLDKLLDFSLNLLAIYLGYLFARFIYYPTFAPKIQTVVALAVGFSLAAVYLYSYHGFYRPMRTLRQKFFVGKALLVTVELIVLSTALVLWLCAGVYYCYVSWVLASSIFSIVFILAKKLTMMSVLRNLRSNRRNLKHLLIVTDSQEMVDSYMEEIRRNQHFGYSVIGYIGNLNVTGLPHLGTTADLDRIIKEYRPDEVVMAFDTVRKKMILRYVSICNDNCVKVLFVPAICGYFKSPRQVSMVGNLPVIDIRRNPLDNPANQIAKRLVDILGSLMLILVTSPLMIFTAIGVRVTSPGPILFRQTRVGKGNREFTMYKFRSMRVNDTEKTGWSSENDPRITRFGAFIRKFALDELPQFFNVLKGDMSLVGPRPEVPFYVEKFKKEIPLYMLKHSLRPGITGLAQIKGLRGDTSIQARIDEDINYIEHWTMLGDFRILLLTPLHAINKQEKYVEVEETDGEKTVQVTEEEEQDEGIDTK